MEIITKCPKCNKIKRFRSPREVYSETELHKCIDCEDDEDTEKEG